MSNKILLKSVKCLAKHIEIFIDGENTAKFAWLENIDKHFPDVFSVEHNFHNDSFIINKNKLLNLGRSVILRLCFSNDTDSIEYSFSKDFSILKFNTPDDYLQVAIENNLLTISTLKNHIEKEKSTNDNSDYSLTVFLESRNRNLTDIRMKIENAPVNIFVIGTCFARSIFKSDLYFNPDYKKYFHVGFTAFHNSLVSLMSEAINDNSYLHTTDLLTQDVFKYIDMEFKKNFFDFVDNCKPDYIFMDNYIDANRPLIEISKNQYLTYNTYFSKSIYKRKFSDCTIYYPCSSEYEKLYREAAKKFYLELKKRNLDKKLIILGGRLSEIKIDELTQNEIPWEDLDYWIRPSNRNWNVMDRILLEEVPDASYIDMRHTNWVNEVNPPIKGGTSPSHYQSGYYRDIFEKLKDIVFIGN